MACERWPSSLLTASSDHPRVLQRRWLLRCLSSEAIFNEAISPVHQTMTKDILCSHGLFRQTNARRNRVSVTAFSCAIAIDPLRAFHRNAICTNWSPCISIVRARTGRYCTISGTIARECSPTGGHRSEALSLSRRAVLLRIVATVGITASAIHPARSAQARNILDEEVDRASQARKTRDVERINSLRRGFDAVELACAQFDDLDGILKGEPPDWRLAQAFARRYNNDVCREGMQPIARGLLNADDKKRGIELCDKLTDTLVEVNRAARSKDRVAALAAVDKARDITREFLRLRPVAVDN